MHFPRSPSIGEQCVVNDRVYKYIGHWACMSRGDRKLYLPSPPKKPDCDIVPKTRTIQIKRSFDAEAPEQLAPGELAFSFVSKTLFIGNDKGEPEVLLKQ